MSKTTKKSKNKPKKKKVKAQEESNPVGRPPIFNSPEEMRIKIELYFKKDCEKITKYIIATGKSKKIPCPTISGLVIYLGFCDRHSFYEYEKKKEFSHTIKRARSFMEREYEQLLRSGNTSGAIFALKNFGWTDKQEIKHTGDIENPVHIKTSELTKEELNEFIRGKLGK